MRADPIVINDVEALLRYLDSSTLHVQWQVLSDIGPGWIGGGRTIAFYMNHQSLADTPILSQLQAALIHAIPIPAESPDAVIHGEGEIRSTGDGLEIEFQWSKAVPYMDPCSSGFGKAILQL